MCCTHNSLSDQEQTTPGYCNTHSLGRSIFHLSQDLHASFEEHLFSNLLLQIFGLINCLLNPLEIMRLWQINPLITSRTMGKGKPDSICIWISSLLCSGLSKIKILLLIPSLLYLALKTVVMKNVLASKLDY